jgi:hypothetical protein
MDVVIYGNGFQRGITVDMDGPTSTTFVSSTVIRVVTPVHDPGVVDVIVTNPDHQSAMLREGYVYRAVTLLASHDRVAPGATISVSWVAPGRSDPDNQGDWIGLFREGAPDGIFLWAQYSTGASGTLTLSAPSEPGRYEFRYTAGDGHVAPAVTIARRTVVVTAGG